MKLSSGNQTIASFCSEMGRDEIVVNNIYQRSDKVWPAAAQSFLIETILLGLPIPKLILFESTDLKTLRTKKEIVDGQQRSKAIQGFLSGAIKLTSNLDEVPQARGCYFDDLDENLQMAFISYQLPIDTLTTATQADVREVFRRMNSYTVPLNAEEQRHAVHQGAFKWFIQRTARETEERFLASGLFTPRQIVRMADTKFFAEIIHALLHGITTTNKKSLDKLYKDFDRTFARQDEIETWIRYASDYIFALDDLDKTHVMKPYQLYALYLAVIHLEFGTEKLENLYSGPIERALEPIVIVNLTSLADAAYMGPDEAPDNLLSFARASDKGTNVRDRRVTRFQFYCQAITDSLPTE